MCGIFGARWSWLARAHADPQAAGHAALRALRWRGPDGAGIVRCGDWVLGCARLAITERRSRQPLVLRGGRFAGVLNGAITNARALWQELRPRLLRRRALPNDAWLPLLLCAGDQPQRLHDLAGHHALAVVDAERDTLWLARDAAGEKPLLVASEGGRTVAFASTTPALRALGVDAAPDAAAVARFFRFGVDGAPTAGGVGRAVASELAGLHRVEGSLAPLAAVAAPRRDVSLHGDGLAAALAAAVRRCVDVDQPVALALSGGIDSSCVAAELAAAGRRVGAYQFHAHGEPDGERAVARAVAAHCGLQLQPVDGGPEVLDALPGLVRAHGLPLGDPSVLAVHALAVRAAQDGVRVLLSGEGADEALLGYRRHRALRWLPARPHAVPAPQWSMRGAGRLLRALAAADPYAELLAVTPPAFRAQALAAAVAGEVALPAGTAADVPPRARAVAARLLRAGAIDAAFYLRWDLLPKLDVATMAAHVEGRCPYLDAEVQAAAASLPVGSRLGKQPLRTAYRARLPAAVFAQRKRGFALPLDRWFRGELPWLDLLRDARTRHRPHLRAAGLDAAIDRHRRGLADLGRALYLVGAFELWLRSREEPTPCA